jgi:hypothetical protein
MIGSSGVRGNNRATGDRMGDRFMYFRKSVERSNAQGFMILKL